MVLLILALLLEVITCEVTFVALPPASAVSIPGTRILVKNIDKTSPDYRAQDSNLLRGGGVVEDTQDRQQFHSLIQDGTGTFYSTNSLVTHACSLQEHQADQFFYEAMPREFKAGLGALVPCLVTGIPTPNKTVVRCSSSSCEETVKSKFSDHVVTADGHLVIRNSSEADSGWYRCEARNVCGNLTSTPILITVRKDLNGEADSQKYYVMSRRTEIFDLNEKEDEHLGSMKELKREMTQYELWKLNTTKPSFYDEVFYPQPRGIYFYYYPIFDSFDFGFNAMYNNPVILAEQNYAGITHNNSFSTHYSYATLPLFVIEFTTDLKTPPIIKPGVHVPTSSPSDETVVTFTVYNSMSSDFQCYRNSIRLVNNWKTKLEMTDEAIRIILKYPLISDGGYYQCSISYDVVYISSPVYVHVEKPIRTYRASATVSATSASLSWELLTLPGHFHIYQGQYVVSLSEHPPLLTSTNSVSFNHLIPYHNYTWHVMTPFQTPLTDLQVFRTSSAIPTSSVGKISVIRGTTLLNLTWATFQQPQWHDSFVFFTVRVTSKSNRSEEIKEWYVKRYSEDVMLTKLYQATQYNVSVTACNSIGCSTNTTNLTLVTKHVELRKRPVVTMTTISLTHVELVTTNVSEGVETYLELFPGDGCFSALPLPSYSLVKLQIPLSRLEYLDTFTTYSLRVQSTNGYSTSPWSACVSFKTPFNRLHVIIPSLCLALVFVLLAVVRALIKTRCPDVVNKLKQALEPKYLNILHEQDEWDTSNEVAIIHTKIENCDL